MILPEPFWINAYDCCYAERFISYFSGADGYNVPDFICDIYFNNGGKRGTQKPCFGGVIALDGKTGKVLWTRWADHKVFAVTCQADLNSDGITDCVVGGMSGVSIDINQINVARENFILIDKIMIKFFFT